MKPEFANMSGGGIDLSHLTDTMSMIGFDEQDETILNKMMEQMKIDSIVSTIDEFYENILKFDYPRSFFSDDQLLTRVKERQRKYFEDFFTTTHDQTFFEKRVKLGAIHERIGLDNNWYLAAYGTFFTKFIDLLSSGGKVSSEQVKSLTRLMLLDIGSVISSYISAREQIINAQASEVIELSSPILKLTDEIIVIPLLGTLDSARAYQIMDKILNSISESNSKVVILDITGVPLIDTATGANLVRTVKAIRLMGSESILTGVRPLLAQTIVELGIDLQSIITRSTLSDGFIEALQLIKRK